LEYNGINLYGRRLSRKARQRPPGGILFVKQQQSPVVLQKKDYSATILRILEFQQSQYAFG